MTTEETTTNLLPCPFCSTINDEHVGLIAIQSHEVKTPAYAVKCLGCGAWGPYGASNKELAIEFWNRRAKVEYTLCIENQVTQFDYADRRIEGEQ